MSDHDMGTWIQFIPTSCSNMEQPHEVLYYQKRDVSRDVSDTLVEASGRRVTARWRILNSWLSMLPAGYNWPLVGEG